MAILDARPSHKRQQVSMDRQLWTGALPESGFDAIFGLFSVAPSYHLRPSQLAANGLIPQVPPALIYVLL